MLFIDTWNRLLVRMVDRFYPPATKLSFCHAKGQKLFDSDGQPLFFIADTAWLLCDNLSEDDMREYFRTREVQGFNTVIVGSNGSWWDSPEAMRPVWRNFDSCLEIAKSLGMFVIPTVQINEYKDGYPVLRLPVSGARTMGKIIGAKYSNHKSILFWMVGGLDEKGVVSRESIIDLASGIRSMDANHLVSFHPASRKTSVQDIPLSGIHQVALYQSYQEIGYEANTAVLKTLSTTGVPFADIEPCYEGVYKNVSASPEDVERVAATCAKMPVCGMAYGHHDIWQFNANWRKALTAGGISRFLYWADKAASGSLPSPDPLPVPNTPVEPSTGEAMPFPMHVFVWGESQDAATVGKWLLSCGFKTGSPVVVICKSGKSPVGITARLVWHPVNEQNTKLPEVLTRIDAARKEGIKVIAIDCEGVATYAANMAAIYARAKSNGLLVIQTPKAYLDHLPGTPAEDCAVLNTTCDVALLWIYGSHWNTPSGNFTPWVELIKFWRDSGLIIQAVPMCDSGRRNFEPYNSQGDILEIIRGCHAAKMSVGIFNIALPDSKEELGEAARLYG